MLTRHMYYSHSSACKPKKSVHKGQFNLCRCLSWMSSNFSVRQLVHCLRYIILNRHSCSHWTIRTPMIIFFRESSPHHMLKARYLIWWKHIFCVPWSLFLFFWPFTFPFACTFFFYLWYFQLAFNWTMKFITFTKSQNSNILNPQHSCVGLCR